jgi:hypothetical protein
MGLTRSTTKEPDPMTIDISPGTVSATAAVVGVAAKIVHSLVGAALEKRDEKLREIESAFKAVKATEVKLFEKLDGAHKELSEFKLHAAETYMAEAKMEKVIAGAFAPILDRLSRIENRLDNPRVSA